MQPAPRGFSGLCVAAGGNGGPPEGPPDGPPAPDGPPDGLLGFGGGGGGGPPANGPTAAQLRTRAFMVALSATATIACLGGFGIVAASTIGMYGAATGASLGHVLWQTDRQSRQEASGHEVPHVPHDSNKYEW